MDALPGDGNIEALNMLKEGRRKESVNIDGDEWMYELEDDPAKQAAVLESYGKLEKDRQRLKEKIHQSKQAEQKGGNKIEVEAIKPPSTSSKDQHPVTTHNKHNAPKHHTPKQTAPTPQNVVVSHQKGFRRFLCCS
eukprot:GGOE01025277.1.p1 GENE.GGOE01025277.1~~GGOE01025277.1.p1  ORF type:complete len:151 (+),score=19.11 GGOE01025277.1:47-454(+)